MRSAMNQLAIMFGNAGAGLAPRGSNAGQFGQSGAALAQGNLYRDELKKQEKEQEKAKKGLLGGSIGSTIGSVAGSFIPVVWPIVGPAIGGAVGNAAGSEVAGGDASMQGAMIGGLSGAIGGAMSSPSVATKELAMTNAARTGGNMSTELAKANLGNAIKSQSFFNMMPQEALRQWANPSVPTSSRVVRNPDGTIVYYGGGQ